MILIGGALGWVVGRAVLQAKHAGLVEKLIAAEARLAEADARHQQLEELRESRAALQAKADAVPELQVTINTQATRIEDLHAELTRLKEERSQLTTQLDAERKSREDDRTALAELPGLRFQLGNANEARATLQAQVDGIPRLEGAINDLNRRIEETQAKNTDLAKANTKLTTQLEGALSRVADHAALLNTAEGKFREAFEALASEALKSNNKTFLELATNSLDSIHKEADKDLKARQQAIDTLLDPVRKTLEKLDTTVHAIEVERVGAYAGLKTQVEALKDGQVELTAQTGNLVKALRAPSPRGRWGEIQLKRVVEMAGMVEHCDFTEQAHVATEEGRLRPDALVHLPGAKDIVIDSKVPLTAYLDALDAQDEATKKACLREHARQVRSHIIDLGSKAYWDELSSSPDFVLMYMPLESAFEAAVQEDPSLIEYAVDRSVIPAGPMTLLAHLKGVAYGWRQERIAANAQEISDLGKELYNRLSTLAGHVTGMGNHLSKTVEAYNAAVGSLERRVLVQARKFKELGAATGEELPDLEMVDVVPRNAQLGSSEEELRSESLALEATASPA
ncbi:MAG TPA: DNA recombination protein RmuC [Vicinamibacteria bacterium]|nr:DNA recombination protein RmuC [Vicinamibacteria bacterium]